MKCRKISAFIPVQNVADIIEPCLESIKWVDEIFIVDAFSTDNTIEICKRYPNVKIVQHEYENSGVQRIWGMPQVAHNWIFIIDSDEQCTPELHKQIGSILSLDSIPYDGYKVSIKTKFLGKIQEHERQLGWLGMRLVNKEAIKHYVVKRVHTKLDFSPAGRIKTTGAYLIHEPIRGFAQYIKKMIRYAEWSAQDMFEQGKRAHWYHFTLRPFFKFFIHYFIKLGFLDGIRGLLLCILTSMNVFFKYYKLYFLQGANNNSDR